MIDTLDDVQEVIDATPARSRERLKLCLPMLDAALANFRASDASLTPSLVIAAATPKSVVVLTSNAWARIPEQKPGDREIVNVVVEAIEISPPTVQTCSVIATGVSFLLGKEGIEEATRDAREIEEYGGRAILVALFPQDAMLLTTVASEVPVVTWH